MKKQKPRREFKSPEHAAAFDQFWDLFWLKKSKKDAADAYIVNVKSTGTHRKVMEALRAQTPEMMGRKPHLRPYGATWLNGERWNDEPLQPPRKPPTPPTATQQAEAERAYQAMLAAASPEDREFLKAREYA